MHQSYPSLARLNSYVSYICCSLLAISTSLVLIGCAKTPVATDHQPILTSTIGPSDPRERARPGAAEFPDAEFMETETGLRYRILRSGSDKRPSASDTVISHYKGWLDDESIFDSSYQRGSPIDFPLSGVISGWTEGLQLIGEGGMIELDIPYYLGYGNEGSPPVIPPKARLHFLVELVKIL